MGKNFKDREPRIKASIPARLRSGGPPQEVWIRNISSRGLMIQALTPPFRGDYIEIITPTMQVAGRVVWVNGRHFGVTVRERMNVERLLQGRPAPAALVADSTARPDGLPERRARPRPEQNFERSRHASRLMQFGATASIGALAAFLLFTVVEGLLSRTVSALQEKL